MTVGVALLALVATLGGAPARGAGGDDPLATIRLEDSAERSWHLGDLAGAPVLLVVAGRRWSTQADAWGSRLAQSELPLAPWLEEGRIAWLSIADLGRVPPWAHAAARERIADRERARPVDERQRRSPLLLDWKGVVARRLDAGREGATVVLLSPERRTLARERGAPTDEAVARVVAAVRRTVPE